jgi:putative transposase
VERISRRNLPHWYVPGAAHFVTYRLAGTIPLSVIRDLQERRALERRKCKLSSQSSRDDLLRVDKQIFAAYDAYLDGNRAINWLVQPDVAAIIRENLYHHRGTKYHLFAYCVMPNHIHVLLQPIEADGHATSSEMVGPRYATFDRALETPDAQSPLSKVLHSLKSYTANRVNELLCRTGQLWQHESYDHWVRDDGELERIVAYIADNPVKAGLAARAEDWRWSSAHDQYVINQDNSGWLDQRS